MTTKSTKGTAFYQRTVKEANDVEKPAKEFARMRGWLVWKFVSPGLRGVPDDFFARAGRVLFIEFKRPDEVPTTQQLERHQELRDHGVEVHWIDNLQDAKTLLR